MNMHGTIKMTLNDDLCFYCPSTPKEARARNLQQKQPGQGRITIKLIICIIIITYCISQHICSTYFLQPYFFFLFNLFYYDNLTNHESINGYTKELANSLDTCDQYNKFKPASSAIHIN